MNKFIKDNKIDNNIVKKKTIKYFSNLFDIKNNLENKKKFSDRQHKRGLTGNILFSHNKIMTLLINNYKKNIGKNNKYYLSLEQFKEKLQENNKKKII